MNAILDFLTQNINILTIVVFASFIGMEVIGKVPTVLHTPLMSGANAISGIVVIGAIILIRKSDASDYLSLSLGALGIALAMVNVVGGYAVTNRMLEMFKKKKRPQA